MTRPAQHPDEVEVLYGYESEEVGLEAGEVARSDHPRADRPARGRAASTSTRRSPTSTISPRRRALGPSALALVRAAEARDIPWVRLNDASLIQVGQGKYQKRIEAALTSQTSHTAVEIASDKELCTRLLHDLGLPVPRQLHVRDAEDAVDAAQRHRLPGGGEAGRRQPRPRRLGQPRRPTTRSPRPSRSRSTKARASWSRA